MTPNSKDVFIQVPFGCRHERVFSSSYSWDNSNRGSEQFVIIQRTTSGRGEFGLHGTHHEVPAGHAFIAIPPEPGFYRWSASFPHPWEFSWINLYGPLGVRVAQEFRRLHGPVAPMDASGPAARRFHELARLTGERAEVDPFAVSAEAYLMMMDWMRERRAARLPDADPVELCAAAFRNRFREPISVKTLAAELGISREHLTRLFVERHQISPARYLRDIRSAEAHTLLEGTRLPPREIALRAGFPSVAAMRRAFA